MGKLCQGKQNAINIKYQKLLSIFFDKCVVSPRRDPRVVGGRCGIKEMSRKTKTALAGGFCFSQYNCEVSANKDRPYSSKAGLGITALTI
jgi:hypothetical protein